MQNATGDQNERMFFVPFLESVILYNSRALHPLS